MDIPTVLLLPGSQRHESYNARLLHHVAGSFQEQIKIDLLEAGQVDLPIFNQDLEMEEGVLRRVALFHKQIKNCQGIVVASPEYNGQLTPFLKNIVDWVSRLPRIDKRFENAFSDRPLLVCSASTGWSGGAEAAPLAQALFRYVGCRVMEEFISVPYADQAWAGGAFSFDPFFDAEIEAAAGTFLEAVHAFRRSQPVALA